MEYRNLGRSGIKVSVLCLGTMQFGWTADEAMSYRILSQACEAGVNFIDSADIYSRWVENNPGGISEKILGGWLKKSAIPRSNLVIATKVRGSMGSAPNDEGLSRVHILKAVEDSLRRLGTDYIDLYQAHWPDENTAIEETLRTFDDLIRQGKVRYIGASNYSAWRLMQALWASDSHDLCRYDTLQPHYNLVHRQEYESELMHICRTYEIGVIPYSPLAGGFLSGKYQRGQALPQSARAGNVSSKYSDDESWNILDKVRHTAVELNATPSQVSLAWLMTRPAVCSPIIGPRTPEQLQDNLTAASLKLSSQVLQYLECD